MMLFSKADLPQKPPKPAASGSSAQTTRIACISIAQTPTIPLPFMPGTRPAVHNKLYFRIPACSETLCSSSMAHRQRPPSLLLHSSSRVPPRRSDYPTRSYYVHPLVVSCSNPSFLFGTNATCDSVRQSTVPDESEYAESETNDDAQ